jgi:hypothetical protein
MPDVPTMNPGGLAVVWAEENTRDAIFTALRNRETYGTSGTRIEVRFFGGWDFSENACKGNYVAMGYGNGVPMGSDLRPKPGQGQGSGQGTGAPRFITAASKDETIGTPLEQIQIVKGWVDAQGTTHEKVYTVAGGDRQSGVDGQCGLTGEGYDQLCGTWQDPDFEPSVPAFYYVRVLENPVCRYTTHLCQQDYGINPLEDDCALKLERLKLEDPAKAADAAFCCSNETTMPIVQPVIQERAWTSPIWYTPPGQVPMTTAGEE